MKKIYLFIKILLLTTSCQGQINQTFLENFKEINSLEVNILQNFKKEVSNEILGQELESFFPIIKNEIYYSERGIALKYFYSAKYKISENYWLVGIKVTENLDYKFLLGLFDKKLNKVVSVIKVEEYSLNNITNTEFKNGVFYIKSVYKNVPNGLDPKPGNEFASLTINNIYKIEKGNFVHLNN